MKKFTRPVKLEEPRGLEGFSCGVELIDDWVQKHAIKAEKHGTAVVYVSYCDGKPAGFYSLSPFSIQRAEVAGGWLKRNVPKQIPAILLGMLAVDKNYQGQGLGAQLLKDAVIRALSAAEIVGGRALLVEPVDEVAAAFYTKYGFERLKGSPYLFVRLAS